MQTSSSSKWTLSLTCRHTGETTLVGEFASLAEAQDAVCALPSLVGLEPRIARPATVAEPTVSGRRWSRP